MKRPILRTQLNMSGSYRIRWYDGQYYVVGNDNAQPCGGCYSTAQRVLVGLQQPPAWILDTHDPDLDEFGRGLADI